MNRRSFIKLVAAAIVSPYLPEIAVPVKVIKKIGVQDAKALWSKKLFDYALEDMVFTGFVGGKDSIIQITK